MARSKRKRSAKAARRPKPVSRKIKGHPTTPQVEPVTPDDAPRLDPAHIEVDLTVADQPPPTAAEIGLTIVGVGASAGGLDACSQLLQSLSQHTGMAFVIVQHLAPKHESVLPDLLAGQTSMPVLQAAEGMEVEADHVYVIPPNAQMGIVEGKLHLLARPDDRSQYLPIDFFFRSLAEYAQSHAVGVILSGTASDGAVGMREIKAHGGFTIVQEPKSARYDGMPRSAILTGAVDLILPPDQIARELMQIARHPLSAEPVQRKTSESATATEQSFSKVFQLLRHATGVDFTHYKLPTIRRRLHRRMVLQKITTIEQYVKFLQGNSAEIAALYQDILIHVTRFFREPESFNVLKNKVFPKILEARQQQGEVPVRTWVPGCSTGEEAYSIAMALLEYLGDDAPGTPIQIFATDVSENAIEQARAGLYTESITADVSPERLRRFFTKTDGGYRINKSVRDLCVFARQDLTRDPPFSKMDLILCRNVLIYLGVPLQKKLMSIFHYAIKPTGFLMLGSAETIGANSDLFAVADKKFRLYTKKLAAVGPEMTFAPVLFHGSRLDATGRKPSAEVRSASNLLNEANRVILGKYSPPGVIVDSEMRIVQFRGQTGLFLEPAPGEPSLNLLKMAREGLLYGLRTALHEARKREATVRKEGLHVKYNGNVRTVNLEVIPLANIAEGKHYLVLFEDATFLSGETQTTQPRATKGPKAARVVTPRQASREQDEQVQRLQQELAANREYLQSIIQDLEAANEELQSANEEILSSNEELQSTNEELDTAKEELQSTNEELNTVNEELQARNEELSRVNSDLTNLLASVQIAIVMVASDLRIRRFTPMAEKVLNLIPSDVGRPISDIKPNIDCPDLEQLINDSIDSVTIKERQVADRKGNSYQLRIRPYKNVENKIDGAVLVLFDSTAMASASERIAATGSDLSSRLDLLSRPVLVLQPDLSVQAANRAFYERFNLSPDDVDGKNVFELGDDGPWKAHELRQLLQRQTDGGSDGGDGVDGTDFEYESRNGSRRRLRIDAMRMHAARDGRQPPILLTIMDVTR
ncbi:MAG TPA: chemotaxis protein CheB [Tepidisphaeraceae bacterium]|jgi:two-component system CheB/CheR fusion protein